MQRISVIATGFKPVTGWSVVSYSIQLLSLIHILFDENPVNPSKETITLENRKEMALRSTGNTPKEIVKQEIRYIEKPAKMCIRDRDYTANGTGICCLSGGKCRNRCPNSRYSYRTAGERGRRCLLYTSKLRNIIMMHHSAWVGKWMCSVVSANWYRPKPLPPP